MRYESPLRSHLAIIFYQRNLRIPSPLSHSPLRIFPNSGFTDPLPITLAGQKPCSPEESWSPVRKGQQCCTGCLAFPLTLRSQPFAVGLVVGSEWRAELFSLPRREGPGYAALCPKPSLGGTEW